MTLAEMLTPHYTVVYIRPGGQYKDVDAGYGADGSEASQGSSGCLLPMGLRGLLSLAMVALLVFQGTKFCWPKFGARRWYTWRWR